MPATAMVAYTPYTWPTTNGRCSKDVNEHVTRLKADFELVSRAVKGSLSNAGILPSELGSGILIGIEQGIAEACSNGYCTNWSKIEKDLLGSVIFKHIATETALEARDRIPLPQFDGLRKSYNALHAKLFARVHPTATMRRPVATDAASTTTSAVGPVNPFNNTNTVTASAQTSEETIIDRQEKKPKDVSGEESEDDSSGDEGSLMENSEGARDGHGMRESEDSESGNNSSEDESSDNDSSGDYSSSSDVASEEADNQESLSIRVESAQNVSKNESEENSEDARDCQELREDEESESENDSGDDGSGDDDSSGDYSGDDDAGDDDSGEDDSSGNDSSDEDSSSKSDATSDEKKVKCASCGGGRRAGSNSCPVKAKARKSLEFEDEKPSKANKSAETRATPSPRVRRSISTAKTQTEASIPSPASLDANPAEDEITSKSDQSLPVANPTQATPPDTPTLLKRIQDVEKVAMALKAALETKSSSRTKRRAGEACEDGAEAESSNIATKRIKQEQPTPENSMGLYHQPSPFIVHRPQ